MRVSLAKRPNNTNISGGRKESNGDVVDTVKKPSGLKKQCIYCAEYSEGAGRSYGAGGSQGPG